MRALDLLAAVLGEGGQHAALGLLIPGDAVASAGVLGRVAAGPAEFAGSLKAGS